MAKKCKNCGAPLSFSKESEEIKCNYCGTINYNHGINIGKIITEFFGQKPQVVRKKHSKKAVVFWLFIGLGIPIIVLLFQFTTIFGNLKWASDCQFIDYNHDGVLDIVGYGRTTARWEILMILDGENGKLLEKKDIQEIGVSKKMYCVDQKHIITTSSDHQLTFYEPEELSKKFTFDLPGSVKGFMLQDKILCLELNDFGDRIRLGIDIATGEGATCKNEKNLKLPEINNYNDYYINNETDIKYMVKYSYKTKTVVSASKQNKILWSKTLDEIKLKPKPFQYTPKHIIIFGEKKGDKDYTYLIGIDNKSGEIQYEVKRNTKTSILLGAYYNHKYLIMYWVNCLEAYDPTTGEMVWSF